MTIRAAPSGSMLQDERQFDRLGARDTVLPRMRHGQKLFMKERAARSIS